MSAGIQNQMQEVHVGIGGKCAASSVMCREGKGEKGRREQDRMEGGQAGLKSRQDEEVLR